MSNQILCPYCKRLITLPSIALGSREKCPHCDLDFVVSYRLISQQNSATIANAETEPAGVKEAAVEEYGLRIPVPAEKSAEALPAEEKESETAFQETDGDEEAFTWRPLPVPSLKLFLKGTFSHPFSEGSRGWLLILLILALAIEGTAQLGSYCFSFPASDALAGSMWLVSAILIFAAIMLQLVYFIMLSALGLAILKDTSEGLEKLINRPQGIILYWMGDAGYVLINLFYGALPALILFSLLPERRAMQTPALILSESILFPIFLISSLAGDSIAIPYSKPVWLSLRYAWHAWALFYLYTLLMGESFAYLLLLIPFRNIWINILCISLLLPVFWIIYFRLLGRLALFCRGSYEQTHPLKTHGGRMGG